MNDKCGTDTGYNRHRRAGETACEACRQAHAAYMRQWNLSTRKKFASGERQIEHGSFTAWSVAGCRCPTCVKAAKSYTRAQTIARVRGPVDPQEHVEANARSKGRIKPEEARQGGAKWTEADISVATERDSSGEYVRKEGELAEYLGRTIHAIQRCRARYADRVDIRDGAGNSRKNEKLRRKL